MTPSALTRPYWGFSPTTPHCDRWFADGASRIGADGGQAQPSGDRSGGSPEDPPAMFSIFQAFRTSPKTADHRTAPVSEFMKILLAEENGARALQPDYDVSDLSLERGYETGCWLRWSVRPRHR